MVKIGTTTITTTTLRRPFCTMGNVRQDAFGGQCDEWKDTPQSERQQQIQVSVVVIAASTVKLAQILLSCIVGCCPMLVDVSMMPQWGVILQ
jgi:hypothetical protein